MNPYFCSAASGHRRLRRSLIEETRSAFEALLTEPPSDTSETEALADWLLLAELHGLPEASQRPDRARLMTYLASLDERAESIRNALRAHPMGAELAKNEAALQAAIAQMPELASFLTSWSQAFDELARLWSDLERSGLLDRDALATATAFASCREDLGRALLEMRTLTIHELNQQRADDGSDTINVDLLAETADLLVGLHADVGFIDRRLLSTKEYHTLHTGFILDAQTVLRRGRADDIDLFGQIAQLLVRDVVCFDELETTYERVVELCGLPLVDDPEPPALAIARPSAALAGRRRTFLSTGTRGGTARTDPKTTPNITVDDFLRQAASRFVGEQQAIADEHNAEREAQRSKAARIASLQATHDQELAEMVCKQLLLQLPTLMQQAARSQAQFVVVAQLSGELKSICVQGAWNRLASAVCVELDASEPGTEGLAEDKVPACCRAEKMDEVHHHAYRHWTRFGWLEHAYWATELDARCPEELRTEGPYAYLDNPAYHRLHALETVVARINNDPVYASDPAQLTGAPSRIYRLLHEGGFPVETVHCPKNIVRASTLKVSFLDPNAPMCNPNNEDGGCPVYIVMRIERILAFLATSKELSGSSSGASGAISKRARLR